MGFPRLPGRPRPLEQVRRARPRARQPLERVLVRQRLCAWSARTRAAQARRIGTPAPRAGRRARQPVRRLPAPLAALALLAGPALRAHMAPSAAGRADTPLALAADRAGLAGTAASGPDRAPAPAGRPPAADTPVVPGRSVVPGTPAAPGMPQAPGTPAAGTAQAARARGPAAAPGRRRQRRPRR